MSAIGTHGANRPASGLALFALAPREVTPKHATFAITLDAAEPYLEDHRPGGDPLLSTVMAIEAAVAGARTLGPCTDKAFVSQIHVQKPFVLTAYAEHVIDLRVLRRGNDSGFHCVLSSLREGQLLTHLHAIVRFDPPASIAIPSGGAFSFPLSGAVIDGKAIYKLFFHGPSFQVVGHARYHAGRMYCRLNQTLPPYHRGSEVVTHTAPRLTEFALQAAGLLEVAAHGQMKIPHSIGAIERHWPIDADAPADLFAVASYKSDNGAPIDIDLIDAAGRLILRVSEYRTIALPFTHSNDAVSALREQFGGHRL